MVITPIGEKKWHAFSVAGLYARMCICLPPGALSTVFLKYLSAMNQKVLQLLLADDDETDRELFEEALKAVPHEAVLHKTTNGEQLMDYLLQDGLPVPDALFLDLNMPRKNGMECLSDIKSSEHLSSIPVFVVSTSMDPEVVRSVYDQGACGYVRKPGSFRVLISTIGRACDLVAAGACGRPAFEHFVLNEKI